MSINNIKATLKDYAKDTRINLGNVLNPENSPELSEKQVFGIALSVALCLQDNFLAKELLEESGEAITEQDITGIKVAVSLMGMNNIYYRSLHLMEDSELSLRPAGLRMAMMANSGIDLKDFEIYCLAISAIAGCGMCLKSHFQKLKAEGISIGALHSVIRIASVIHAAHQSISLK